MMDFEAVAKHYIKEANLDEDAFTVALLSGLLKSGSESMKNACIEVVKEYIPTQDYAGNYPMDDLVKKIERL